MKFFSGFIVVGLFSLLALRVDAEGTVAARIVAARVRGEVSATVKATKVRSVVTENSEVSQGSIVMTAKGASVVLVFSNGATVNLGTDSSLDIEQFTQDPFSTPFNAATITAEPSKSNTRLNLMRGELVAKVAKLKKDEGSTFTVSTPVGAAGIRGTVFRIVYRPDGNGKAAYSLTVQVGEVEQTFTGVVNAPASVTENKEISGEVDVKTDANGQTTITLPTGQTFTVKDASAESMAAITAAIQAMVQGLLSGVNGAPGTPPGAQRPADAVTPLTGR